MKPQRTCRMQRNQLFSRPLCKRNVGWNPEYVLCFPPCETLARMISKWCGNAASCHLTLISGIASLNHQFYPILREAVPFIFLGRVCTTLTGTAIDRFESIPPRLHVGPSRRCAPRHNIANNFLREHLCPRCNLR